MYVKIWNSSELIFFVKNSRVWHTPDRTLAKKGWVYKPQWQMTLYHTDPLVRLSFILIDKILNSSFLGLVEDPRTILRSMNDLLIEALEKHWYILQTPSIQNSRFGSTFYHINIWRKAENSHSNLKVNKILALWDILKAAFLKWEGETSIGQEHSILNLL